MAPWKCPDCGVWWAGLEHRCQYTIKTETLGGTTTFTVRCNCVYTPDGFRIPQTITCPVHDVAMTYTTFPAQNA